MIHKTSDQNIRADPDLSWVTDASEQMSTGAFFYLFI